ncbi:hypothetical protein E0198_001560 [Clavispora lusitaniae]|nr:hypothetical protein E0198_001560 [Clavispora lusitaniae]
MQMNILFCLLWVFTLVSSRLVIPQLPENDDFYKAPDNLQDYKEGDIINWRKTPSSIRSVYYPIHVKNSWQFLVRSKNSVGNATAVVTTVLEPYNADPSKLLSYQYMEDSPSINCSPSYSMLFNARLNTVFSQFEMILIGAALSKGWYVVAPDYEGLHGAFTAGIQSGQATLDSIRAVLHSKSTTGVNEDAKVALWGYSGGTIATGWAAQLQPRYAPELKGQLIGAAVGGLVTNITLTAVATDGTPFAGLIPNCIHGLMQEYPELDSFIRTSQLNPLRAHAFEDAADNCLLNSVLRYPFHNFFGGIAPYFTKGWDFFHEELPKKLLAQNTLALKKDDGIPQIPLFIYHGTPDEVVPFPGAERLYDNYCEWGIGSLEFAESTSTGHLAEVAEGSGAAIKWLQDRYEGVAPVSGCSRTVRKTNFEYPGADNSYYEIFRTVISTLLGQDVGSLARNVTTPEYFNQASYLVRLVVNALGNVPLR